MRERSLVIGGILSIIIIIIVAVILTKVGPNIKINNKVVEDSIIEKPSEQEEDDIQETLTAIIEGEEKAVDEEPQIRDAARITQDLQEIDANIGALYIPKTGLKTEVYCKQNANKMEEMPCMLYTNEGPNQPGVTVLVGHNRDNGLLFSNNNKLEENDEFFFKYYINGTEKTYKVYSKSVKKNDDVSFYNEQSNIPILIMQCCLSPTDSENVLIIMAKAEN